MAHLVVSDTFTHNVTLGYKIDKCHMSVVSQASLGREFGTVAVGRRAGRVSGVLNVHHHVLCACC